LGLAAQRFDVEAFGARGVLDIQNGAGKDNELLTASHLV
jgi:hypothetical protein